MKLGFGGLSAMIVVAALALGGWQPVHAQDMIYTFRPGDSLWKVCEQYARDPQACWRELAQRNGIRSPRAIPPGARLRIPAEWLKQQPEPAIISEFSGQVLLYRKVGGEPVMAEIGLGIEFGDALETGPQGLARIDFADGTWLQLRPDSLVVFDAYSRYRESGMVDTSLRLERGRIRTWVKPRRGEGQRFIITTPSAVAAVRGTEFDLSVDRTEVLRNEVTEGVVEVSASGVAREVPAGYATLARPGEPPLDPVPMLAAPGLHADTREGKLSLDWDAVRGAQAYRLELYRVADNRLVSAPRVTETHWQQTMEPGEYRLLARAEDANGLRGHESALHLSVEAPPVATEPQQEGSLEILVFVLGAALLLAL